jgi:hypothetical protein
LVGKSFYNQGCCSTVRTLSHDWLKMNDPA